MGSPPAPSLLREIRRRWRENHVVHLGAALAYYALFSTVPLLAIGLAVMGEVFGPQLARVEVVRQLQGLAGAEGAKSVEQFLFAVRPFSTTAVGTATSFAVLLWGAHLVFSQLKSSLNIIWGVRRQRNPVTHFLVVRVVSLALVSAFVVAVVTFASLTVFLAALARTAPENLPLPGSLLQGIDFVVSFVLTTLLVGLVYKFLPDTRVAWRDVWMAAPWTALLMAIGKAALAAYFSRMNLASIYGAAVSLIVGLVAVFLYAQILLLGAVFTAALATRRGAAPVAQPAVA